MFLRDVQHPEKVCLIRVKHVGNINCDQGSLQEISIDAPIGKDWLWSWTVTRMDQTWTQVVLCEEIIGVEEYNNGPVSPHLYRRLDTT